MQLLNIVSYDFCELVAAQKKTLALFIFLARKAVKRSNFNFLINYNP